MYQEAASEPIIILSLIWLSLVVFSIVAHWKIYVKAGKPGWGIFIPIYNAILFLEIAGRPWWWLFLTMIPFVNIVFVIILTIDFAKAFNKSAAFGIGLMFLPIIFYGILAFDKDTEYWGEI